jgi:hypothetical protein
MAMGLTPPAMAMGLTPPAMGIGRFTPSLQAMAMVAGPPAGWRSIAPAGTEAKPKLSRDRPGSKMGMTAACRQPPPRRNGVGIVMDRASLSTACQSSRA